MTLRLAGATVRRGRRTVLDRVDLDVRAGELLAVLGPNGAGKSTALAALAGDLPLVDGTAELDGLPLAAWGTRDLARRRAVLLQSGGVAFPFSVLDVVRMGRTPWRGTSAEAGDDDAVERALAVMELDGFAHRPVPSLSGGEQARVALARTLAQESGILLLDEPTAALDLHHAEVALQHLRGLAASGRAVAVVLHDLDLASAYADRVVLVAGGRVVADGLPGTALDPAVLSDAYGHPVEVVRHPTSGRAVVLPLR